MRAHEVLEALLAGFREAAPQAEVREAYGFKPASRLLTRPVVAGQIVKESAAGDGWEAKLSFTLYLPQGQGADQAEELLDLLAERAKALYPELASVERGAASVDKTLGVAAVTLTVSFQAGGGNTGAKNFLVLLNGEEHRVSGWKLSAAESEKELVAVGEEEAFFHSGRRVYSIELQGLDAQAQSLTDGFTAQLGGRTEVYQHCRWKSMSGAGTGVFQSDCQTEEE